MKVFDLVLCQIFREIHVYLIAFAVIVLIWRFPQKEKLAFGLFAAAIVAEVVLFFVASAASTVPGLNW